MSCENDQICTKCAPGHTLRKKPGAGPPATECIECPTADGCATCGGNKCLTCKEGYFLTDDGLCHECKSV